MPASASVAVSQSLGANLGVALPEGFVRRKRIDHSRSLAVPFGMLVAIENVVGHVAGANDGAGHDAGDLFAWAGESEHRAGEDGFAVCALRK